MRSSLLPSAVIVLALGGASAHAQQDFTGARSLGMGGAHRAVVTGNDAVYLNPAGMSLTRKYGIEVGYLADLGRETHVFPALSIVDSVTASVAAGIAYTYVTGKVRLAGVPGKVDRTGHVGHFALSGRLSRQVTLGMGAKYMDVSYGGRTAVNAVTAEVGLHYQVSPHLSLAVAGYGLTNSGSAEAPVAMAVAFAAGPSPKLQFAVDWVIDFTSRRYLESLPAPREGSVEHQVRAGIEALLGQYLGLRAGYFYDRVTRPAPDHGLAAGVGIFAPRSRFGLNVVFEQRFGDTSERQIVAAFQLFL